MFLYTVLVPGGFNFSMDVMNCHIVAKCCVHQMTRADTCTFQYRRLMDATPTVRDIPVNKYYVLNELSFNTTYHIEVTFRNNDETIRWQEVHTTKLRKYPCYCKSLYINGTYI